MKCPFCGSTNSRVIDTREVGDGIRRRRECQDCHERFTTYERVARVNLLVIKRDGRREPFVRDKLSEGIRIACAKRPIPSERIEALVDAVESSLYRLGKAEVASRVETALSLTGTLELASRPPHHLSGGEKRMVSIAGVLAMQPRLIIYDEPSANLDIRSRRRLISFLQASRETILIASHDLELVLEVCNRVVLLDEGHIVADGDPRETMGDVALMEAHGLERPHSLVHHAEPHHGCSGEVVTKREI